VHECFGFIFFFVVLGLQLAVVGGLKRWAPAKDAGRPAGPGAAPPSGPGCQPVAAIRRRKLTVALAVVVTALVVVFAVRRIDALPAGRETGVRLAPDGRNPVALPAFLGTEWIGRAVAVSALERAILPPDTGYSRELYVSVRDRTHQVLVSIVLSGRDRSSIHRPELCLVGQGWTIRDRYDHAFTYPGAEGATFPATVLHVQHEAVLPDGQRVMVPSVVAYWFMTHDRVVATNWERMFWGVVDRLHHLRSPRWAYVLLQTDAGNGDPAALARMQAVLNQVLPDFQEPPPR
jgi:Protein of unknown function (DUF3485)